MSRRADGDSGTPARNTRARSKSQTPLPAVVTKQSHAYGAQGKTSLHTQLRRDGGNFAEEFTAATSAASPAKKGGLRERGGRVRRPETIVEDGDGEEEAAPAEVAQPADPARLVTSLGQGQGYQRDSAGGQGPGMVHAVQEPSVWRVSFRAFPRWARLLVLSADGRTQVLGPLLLRLFAFCCLGMLLYAWVPLPESMDRFRFQQFWAVGMFWGIPGFERPPEHATEMWYRARHDVMLGEILPDHNMPEIQWAVNLNVLERLKDSEVGQQAINSTLGLHGETLAYLKRILPVTVVLEDDGEQRYKIPAAFWEALSQRIAEGGDEVSPLWDSFISSNKKQILELSTDAAEKIVGEAAQNKQLVSREDFAQHLQQHNLDLAEKYTEDYRLLWEQNFETVREVARKTTEEVMREFTTSSLVKQQLNVLKKAVDVQNSYEALRSYNWFTFGEGAIIDPRMTSPTADPEHTGWFSKFWDKSGPLSYTQNSPATVLFPWTEVTDCWCAAPAKDGSAQITLYMTEPVHPDRLVVEHIPARGTRRIANAPRTIEIWADVGSAAEVTRFGDLMAQKMPYASQSECTKRPTETHVCIGRQEYDIHNHNHVQQFRVWPEAIKMGLAVHSFTIRIVNNWGGPRTCIYRLRMLGDEVIPGEVIPDEVLFDDPHTRMSEQ